MWRCTSRLLSRGASPTAADLRAAFAALGLPSYSPSAPPAALSAAVRRHYRELARRHHPDLSSGDDSRMKVINTAYELIQASGILRGGAAGTLAGSDASSSSSFSSSSSSSSSTTATNGNMENETKRESEEASKRQRFARRAGSRRHRMPDDFASGDENSTASWAMKSSLDWQSLMNSTDGVTTEELRNPANHPFSHSKFFTFDEDVAVYKMIRGGATVPQVARTLGKPSTFIEKRLHNAQFKLRVQYVLRGEKRGEKDAAPPSSTTKKPRHGGEQPTGPTPAPPSVPNAQQRLLRRAVDAEALTKAAGEKSFFMPTPSGKYAQRGGKRREWEPTMPTWEEPQYFADKTLEEKGRDAKLWEDRYTGDANAPWGAAALLNTAPPPQHLSSAIGRSYANYARLRGTRDGKLHRSRRSNSQRP